MTTSRSSLDRRGLSDGGVVVASFMLVGAALVHLAVAPAHFAEWWVLGVLFCIATVLQGGLAVALVWRPTATVALWIGVVNAGIVVVWLLSRTSGLPFGPDAGSAEGAGWLDVLTMVDEILLILLLSIECRWTAQRLAGPWSAACRICGSAVALAMTLAFAGGVGHA